VSTTAVAPRWSGVGEPATTEFLLRFARTGHHAGYETAELEERIKALAHALGVRDVEASATPTVVDIALGPLAAQQTYSLRVRPSTVDLGAIADLDDLVTDVLDGKLDAARAIERLAAIEASPIKRPYPVILAAYVGAAVVLTPMLGGGRSEAAAAAIVGAVSGVIAIAGGRLPRLESIVAPLAAMAASFTASIVAHAGLGASRDLVTLAALVPLLPGMTLTVGMRELASKQLQSGVANTADALFQLLGLVFGVEIGRTIADAIFSAPIDAVPGSASSTSQAVCAALAGLAFTGTLRARTRDAPLMCAATLLALCTKAAGTHALGPQLGVLVGALAVGATGAVVGGRLRRSPLVFIVPGVLMLVPGSLGLRSVLQLLTNQTVGGLTAGVDTLVTAGSIAYGLMIAAAVLPRPLLSLGPSQEDRSG
jgi:uncharacterized membrane protein YjjP (DUF1212 family)